MTTRRALWKKDGRWGGGGKQKREPLDLAELTGQSHDAALESKIQEIEKEEGLKEL